MTPKKTEVSGVYTKRQFIDIAPIPLAAPSKRKGLKRLAFLLVVAVFACGGTYYLKKFRPFDERIIFQMLNPEDGSPSKPELPDISGFTVEMIAQKVPAFKKGRIKLSETRDYVEFSKFKKGDVPLRLQNFQNRENPQALIVSKGHYNWTRLYEEVKAIDPEGKLIRKEGATYLLRVPLLVYAGASLVISDSDAEEIRLSKQANTFLVNRGDFFILRTSVTGWDEVKNEPSYYSGDKHDYRPFIVTWGGSNLYIAGSRISSLGYMKGKSYGITFSTCLPCMSRDPTILPPKGIIVESFFTDLYYAFYSYEAEDVAIIGNIYANNVVYGIDPHDRSRRLIIAGNEAYGTRKHHGIIGSRKIEDSWIFNNHSHHNNGSGIVLDRSCTNNVIADNLVEYNQQDGITIYESENNMLWGNKIENNQRNGVRIRNSWDLKMYHDKLAMNKEAAIEIYTDSLSGDERRDVELDPYTENASLYLHEALVSSSSKSAFKIKGKTKISFSNTDLRLSSLLFPKSFVYNKQTILSALNEKDMPMELSIAPAPGLNFFSGR